MALRGAGFEVLDGIDVTPKMLEIARGKGIYRNLTLADPAKVPPVAAGAYGMITAIGVIGLRAVPLSLLDVIMRLLPKGGLFALSLNDHALSAPAFEGKFNEWLDCAAARLKFREHGDHIPGKSVKFNIYITEKA